MKDIGWNMGRLGRFGLLWSLLAFAYGLLANSPKSPNDDTASWLRAASDNPALLQTQTKAAFEQAKRHGKENAIRLLARLILISHQLDDGATLLSLKDDVERFKVQALHASNFQDAAILTMGLSSMAYHENEYERAQVLVEEARRLAESSGDVNTSLQVLYFASDLYYRLDLDPKSLAAVLDSKYLMEKSPGIDPTLKLILEASILQLNFEQDRTLPNLKLLERYYLDIKAARLRFQAGVHAFFLADAYSHLPDPDHDKAFRYFLESYQTSLAIDDLYTASAASYKLAFVSNARKDPRAALKYGQQALDLMKGKRSIWRFKNHREMANAYLELNDLAKAEESIQESLREISQDQVIERIKSSEVALVVYKKLGKTAKALETSESIIQLMTYKHNKQAKAEFTEKKVLLGLEASSLENQILEKDRQLAEKDSQLKSIELERMKREGKFKTAIAIASFLGFLILAGLLLKVQRQRHRINELNEHLQTNVLARFLPPSLVKDLVENRIVWDEHAQQMDVTILFADIVNFTRSCERKSPQRISEIMNRFFSAMSQTIYSEQGTLDKFIGDAVMVLFGAPVVMEKSVQIQHAVACARRMLEALDRLNDELEAEDGTSFRMRIGIHHGPVVAGMFGSLQRSDYTALGMTVNIASRIEGKASPNQILASRTVVEELAPEQWEPAGFFHLKGISESHELFAIRLEPRSYLVAGNE